MLGERRRYRLNLIGTFRLFDPDGRRIEIASRRGAALIAILAMSPAGERKRPSLQDRLWGSRGAEQAAASLRKELHRLRPLVNAGGAALLTTVGHDVRLDLSQVAVDARGDRAAEGGAGEFLEGFDIPGEEGFEDWLREQRQLLQTPAAIAAPDAEPMAGDFAGRPALAVLPFRNLTDDPGAPYIAEGLSEDLIDRLSRLRWLPVIARSSSFSLAEGQTGLVAVRDRLGAKYVLEGRLRGARGEAWLSASLSDAESGHVIWSQRFQLPEQRAGPEMEAFVAELVGVLDSRIDHAEQERARVLAPSDHDVSQLIWRGRWHLNRFTRDDAEAARRLFEEALALDPSSPEALIQATFARAWHLWAVRGTEAEVQEMRRLAQRAIIADCEDSRGYMLAGVAEMWLRRPERASALLRQSISLNPSLAMAHAQLGGCHNLMGDPQAAVTCLAVARRLSPNDMHLFYLLGELAMAHWIEGRQAEAIALADEAIVRRPAYWYAHLVKINALVDAGYEAPARSAYREMLAAKPRFEPGYMAWIPFVDAAWNARLAEGLRRAMAEDGLATATREGRAGA